MFSTLRYTKDASKETICIEQANDLPGQGHGQRHSACNYCRAKKLKCLGENRNSERKEDVSCDRCRTNGIKCVFPEPSSNKGSKRRRSTQINSRTSNSTTSTPSSPAAPVPKTLPPQVRTGMNHEVVRGGRLPRTYSDSETLSDEAMQSIVGFEPERRAQQPNTIGTQSLGGHIENTQYSNNRNDLTHQFDFNLSMLSTADDSHHFDYSPNNSNEWSAVTYGLHDANVYRNYNPNGFSISPSSYPVDYGHVDPAVPWGMPTQPNNRPFHMGDTWKP